MATHLRVWRVWPIVFYLCAGELVLIGLLIPHSVDLNRRETPRRTAPAPNLWLHLVTQWDAQSYVKIVKEGYEYDPKERSSVAYFPAYPLLGRTVALMTGWSGHASAWAVAQACLVASFGVFWRYLGDRWRFQASDSTFQTGDAELRRRSLFAIAALALYPPCFFMWMAYSDSLFLLLCVVVMLGIQRDWHPMWIALLTGAATAARPVGVALLAPLALYIWRREQIGDGRSQIMDWRRHAKTCVTLATLLAVASWGLAAYMAFQWYEFGTPLAFVQTQEHWSIRPKLDWPTKALLLASGEPIWSAYVPGSGGHWTRQEEGVHPLLSLHFFDPLYFVAAVLLVSIGRLQRWLNGYEFLLAAGLLLIPYITKGYEMTMSSQARYTTVVFPIYIVLGELLGRAAAWWVTVAFFAVCAVYFLIYSAMWAAGHVVI